MTKLIRNDYTFINRIEKIKDKYLNLSCKYELSDTWNGKYLRLCLMFSKAISDIKEDMRLRTLRELHDMRQC